MAKSEKHQPESAVDPAEVVRVRPDDLQAEFVRLPADTYYWGCRYVEACEAYNRADLRYDEVRAQVRLKIKFTAEKQGAKVTLPDIEALVHDSADYGDAAMRRLEAEATRDKAKMVVDALRAKKDMLVQLGAQQRAEMQSDPMIRDKF